MLIVLQGEPNQNNDDDDDAEDEADNEDHDDDDHEVDDDDDDEDDDDDDDDDEDDDDDDDEEDGLHGNHELGVASVVVEGAVSGSAQDNQGGQFSDTTVSANPSDDEDGEVSNAATDGGSNIRASPGGDQVKKLNPFSHEFRFS